LDWSVAAYICMKKKQRASALIIKYIKVGYFREPQNKFVK